MEITKNVILDLLPLYFAKEATADTNKLIEAYLKENPGFASTLEPGALALDSVEILDRQNKDEMSLLQKTKNWLRLRSFIMGLAIFFTFLPFTFDFPLGAPNEFRWAWINNPSNAIALGIIAAALWVVYYLLNRRLSV